MINLNEIFAQMIALLSSAYAEKWPEVKSTAENWIFYAKSRFANYVQMAADGEDAEHLLIFLHAEENSLLQVLQTFEVITLSSAQQVANQAIEIFSKAFLPVEVPGSEEETDEDPSEGMLMDTSKKNFVAQPVMGVMFADESNPDTKISVAKQLGVDAIRTTISLNNWKGKSVALDKYIAAGFKLNVNVYAHNITDETGTRIPQPFPTGDALEIYKAQLTDFLSKYKPDLLTIENEEMVALFHSGPKEDYVAQLFAAMVIAHMAGVRVTNGGLCTPVILVLTYRKLIAAGRKYDAGIVYNAMDLRVQKAAANIGSNKDIEAKVDDANYLLQAYAKYGIDFVNFHWYEYLTYNHPDDGKTSGALGLVMEFLQDETGKKVVCTEMGQHTANTDLTIHMLDDVWNYNLRYLIWASFTSRAENTFPLNDGDKLNASGEVFKKFLTTY